MLLIRRTEMMAETQSVVERVAEAAPLATEQTALISTATLNNGAEPVALA